MPIPHAEAWRPVAYLCIGWPRADDRIPELERAGWQDRQALCRHVETR